MDREELLEARGRLEAFLELLLPWLGRSERAAGELAPSDVQAGSRCGT